MTRAEIRRLGHQMLEHVEWLDRNVTVRAGKPHKCGRRVCNGQRHLEGAMADLHKFALKLIDAPLRLVEEDRDA